MKKLISKKNKDGYYHFYIGRKDVTGLWMDFFSGLSMKQEGNAEMLFYKKYKKLFV